MDSGKDSGLKDRRERRDEIGCASPTVSEFVVNNDWPRAAKGLHQGKGRFLRISGGVYQR
jgi:hypothetical protein